MTTVHNLSNSCYYYTKCRLEGALRVWEQNTVNPVNMDIEGAIESILINRVSVLNISRLNLEKM